MSGGGHTHCVRFHDIASLTNLYGAWREFRRGKARKFDVQIFEFHLENELFKLHKVLHDGTYTPEGYQDFFVKDPKLRHIHKAGVRDRVVHQALFRVLYPCIDRKLSSSVYSARVGYGTHRGVKHLFRTLRKETKNWKKEVWVLKIDIRKFFDTIDHNILKEKIATHPFDTDTQHTLFLLIDSFHKTQDKGLPLGNVTSQLFANMYLNKFDWFVKNDMEIKHYFRYCDDMVFVLSNRNHATALVANLKKYLKVNLLLDIHPNKISIRKVTQGIDFLGHVILPHTVVLRTTTKKRIYKKLHKNEITKQSVDSYLGVATYARGRKLTKILLQQKTRFD